MIGLFNQPNISKHPTCRPKFESIKFLNSPKFVFSAHPEFSLFLQLIFVVAGTVLIASLDFILKTYNILYLVRVSMRISSEEGHLFLRGLPKDCKKSSTSSRTLHCLHVLPLIPQAVIGFGWSPKTHWWQLNQSCCCIISEADSTTDNRKMNLRWLKQTEVCLFSHNKRSGCGKYLTGGAAVPWCHQCKGFFYLCFTTGLAWGPSLSSLGHCDADTDRVKACSGCLLRTSLGVLC